MGVNNFYTYTQNENCVSVCVLHALDVFQLLSSFNLAADFLLPTYMYVLF